MATIEELEEIVEAEQQRSASFAHRLMVCTASGCPNGLRVRDALMGAVEAAGRRDEIEVIGVGCLGLCAKGTLVAAQPDDVMYGTVAVEDAAEIVAALGERARPAPRGRHRGTVL